MFERFTDRSRRVLVLAQEEARLLKNNHIGTEHLLLGLLGEAQGVAALALASFDVEVEAVRTAVRRRGTAGTTDSKYLVGSPPFTPRAKKVLELSLREALQLEHKYIGTEHILLGLIREGDGVGAHVLMELGVELSQIRSEVVKLISGQQGAPRTTRQGRGTATREPPIRLTRQPKSDGPACPGCRVNLADTLRWRTQAVIASDFGGSGGEAGRVRQVTLWWCRACGRTIAVTPEGTTEPDQSTDSGGPTTESSQPTDPGGPTTEANQPTDPPTAPAGP